MLKKRVIILLPPPHLKDPLLSRPSILVRMPAKYAYKFVNMLQYSLPLLHHPFLQHGRVYYAHHVVGFAIVIVVVVIYMIRFFNGVAIVQIIEPIK